MTKTTNKGTKATKEDNKDTKKDTKEVATNNKSDYGHKATNESDKGEKRDIMNSDMLTGYKLIETASKMLARKHKSLSKDMWRKEASELYQHNECFDGEPVNLSWFISKLENIAANKYGNSDTTTQGGDSDLQSFLELKKRGIL